MEAGACETGDVMVCKKCKQDKSSDEFATRSDTGKLRNVCTECRKYRTSKILEENTIRNSIIDRTGSKTCCRCHECKPKHEFFGRRSASDGLSPACKKCNNSYYSEEFKSRKRANHRRVSDQLRDAALKFLGNRCAKCGIEDKRVLQIDHINGGGVAEKKKLGWGVWPICRDVLSGVPNKYQLLCANCNWIKRFEMKEHPKRID